MIVKRFFAPGRFFPDIKKYDSIENRTRVTAVKGRCLNRLTMEPHMIEIAELAASYFPGQSPAKYHRR